MTIIVQCVVSASDVPGPNRLETFARAALADEAGDPEVCLRLVDAEEGKALNARYRGRDYPTNVLSFPGEPAMGILGDIVVCVPVVRREAAEQGKAPESHWAHMVVHGMLHLQGYDHQQEEEAQQMEARERAILATFRMDNPYEFSSREQLD